MNHEHLAVILDEMNALLLQNEAARRFERLLKYAPTGLAMFARDISYLCAPIAGSPTITCTTQSGAVDRFMKYSRTFLRGGERFIDGPLPERPWKNEPTGGCAPECFTKCIGKLHRGGAATT